MPFSTQKNDLIARENAFYLKELTRAYIYFSQPRIDRLVLDMKGEGIKISDIRVLGDLAQNCAESLALHGWIIEGLQPVSSKTVSEVFTED